MLAMLLKGKTYQCHGTAVIDVLELLDYGCRFRISRLMTRMRGYGEEENRA